MPPIYRTAAQQNEMNIETLNAVGAGEKEIVTDCPHCLHTLDNEYLALGGDYTVLHHTQLISELIGAGRLQGQSDGAPISDCMQRVTFYDSCYLGRHNGEYNAPREALIQTGVNLLEMERHKSNAFCCGAGSAQVWKEEEEDTQTVSPLCRSQSHRCRDISRRLSVLRLYAG